MSEPMVNVNLSTNCGCIGPNPGFHLRGCSATAVNIPCPPPPSVEMKVVLGGVHVPEVHDAKHAALAS